MFTTRRIKLKMVCSSGFSREAELTVCVYRKSDLLWGVGSCDCGGWKVPKFVGWEGKLETQQRWWCSSKSELEGLRTRRVDGVSSSPKAHRLYTEKESMFQFKCEGRENPTSQLKDHQAGGIPSYLVECQPFCSIQAFNWLGKTHTHWRRNWHPTPVLLPGRSHGQRRLVGYVHGVAKSWTWLSDFIYTHWGEQSALATLLIQMWISSKLIFADISWISLTLFLRQVDTQN